MPTTAVQNRTTGAGHAETLLRGPHVACPRFRGDVVAVGGELKNTICYGTETTAVISEPHGNLACADNYRRFVSTVTRLLNDLGDRDVALAHDLHPMYLSTQFARRQTRRRIAVQHHHAHAVACAVDAGIELPVIGVACDGTGYGPDGAIWGGEVLFCEADASQRMAHLDYFALPGGDAAALFPWRPALSILRETFPEEWPSLVKTVLPGIEPYEAAIVVRQLESGLNTPATSSLGRLFDAVASLLGVCLRNEHEGQAAMALERLAGENEETEGAYEVDDRSLPVMDWRPMIRGIIGDLDDGIDRATISRRFHSTLAAMFASAVQRAAGATGVKRVVLSGGCFLNRRLRRELVERLTGGGFGVGLHRQVSPGDAGLSLGQAVIASAVAAGGGTFAGAS